jgi:hypothetical protein
MIRLGTEKKEPRRLALGAGAAILYRPATTIDQEAAGAAARRMLEATKAGLDALDAYGFPPTADFTQDGDLAFALVSLINLVELGLRVIVDWEGIGDAAGAPAPVTRENLAALLRDPIIFAVFKQAILQPILDMEFEGNGFAPSPSGAPAAAPATAPAVAPSTPLAPAADAASTANAVPNATAP